MCRFQLLIFVAVASSYWFCNGSLFFSFSFSVGFVVIGVRALSLCLDYSMPGNEQCTECNLNVQVSAFGLCCCSHWFCNGVFVL